METFNLDLIPKGSRPVCHVSQYDTGRTIKVNLFEGSNPFTLAGTETISISVRKPDGHIVTEGLTNTSSTYVDVVTTEQMTACEGSNLCEVKIEKGSDVIGTLNFIMQVEADPLAGGDPSESFIYNLNAQIYAAVADQYDSANVIFDSTPTSGHNTPYTVTSAGIKDKFDNLKVADLSDVTITTPVQGEALVFDLTDPDNPVIVNGTVSTVGSLDDLNDVDTTGKVKDSSVVWDGTSEFVAKKLTEEVTQAEYDQLKLDGDLVEGVHYVITDGQNVTCNLGDLNDVDTTGANTGDILVKGVSGWSKSDTLKLKTPTNTVYGSLLSGGYIDLGSIVIVDINLEFLQNASNSAPLLSGLPTEKINNVSLTGVTLQAVGDEFKGFRMYQGSLYVNSAKSQGAQMHVYGSYTKA